MAKKATAKSGGKAKSKGTVAKRSGSGGGSSGGRGSSSSTAGDAFINLLQSPLAAELVAVAATAAIGALAQRSGKPASKTVKDAGKAAAKAVGQRLSTEIDEIRKASKAKKA